MQTIRWGLTVLSFGLLVGGYIASQAAYHMGLSSKYASAIDQPTVKWLSLMLLVGAIVCSFAASKENEDGR